jgi:hypothetical protein
MSARGVGYLSDICSKWLCCVCEYPVPPSEMPKK